MSRILLVLSIGLLAPTAIHAQEGTPPRLDRFGDPLPVGALARLGTLRFHNCRCAAYSPDGKFIVTANSDEVTFWDPVTSKKVRQLKLDQEREIVGLTFSHDGKKLAAIGWGGTSIQVWDLQTFNRLTLVPEEGRYSGADWSSSAAFSSDDKTLVAATSGGLSIWNLASGKKINDPGLS